MGKKYEVEKKGWKKEAVRLMEEGNLSWRGISRLLGIPRSTVSDHLRGYALPMTVSEESEPLRKVVKSEPEGVFLDNLCQSNDYDTSSLAKRLRTAQRTNNQLRKIINQSNDQTEHFSDMIKAVEVASARINKKGSFKVKPTKSAAYSEECIVELLFSDLQIGKIGQYYDSEKARKAIKYYGEEVLRNISERKYLYKKIVFASLGDIVEDHLKHEVQSAISTDAGLAEQMAMAIQYIWEYVLKPLAELGIPMEFIGVAGNHGSSSHRGNDMYKAGLFSYDYVIYKSLQGYCKALGFDHVKFNTPEGIFAHTEIFDRVTIYEHGYFNTCTEKSMNDQMRKRGQQIKKHVDYFRCGDMHHLCSYDNHKMVLNGAFFGIDDAGVEYSGILGFNSIPTQAMMFHVDEKIMGRNSVKEFVSIQVSL